MKSASPSLTPPVSAPTGATVVVGLSGGVDSSVAAHLLKEQGYRVIGLFMKNWEEEDPETGVCTATQDYEDVARVSHDLGIPYYSVNFSREYRDRVFQRFLEDYQRGRTPNPDVLCNREIKFDVFLEKALSLGADYVATGHYCRRGQDAQGRATLLKGLDPGKDQSYFLNAVPHTALEKTLFPIGELPKAEVRAIAQKLGLVTHDKKDSTGICFIGERRFREFLGGFIGFKPGAFRTLDGTRVGRHHGAAFYTLGQRKGLGLGGEGEPWFVVAKDVSTNTVYVERGVQHPALFCDELLADEVTWVSGQAPFVNGTWSGRAKIRYRQSDQVCQVEPEGEGLRIRFQTPQRAATPGQSVVFYDGDTCLGGATIATVGPTYFQRGLPVVFSNEVSPAPSAATP